jgi:SAM-dependent methyltransferase
MFVQPCPLRYVRRVTYTEFLQSARAFQESRVLLSAIELDVFTAVGAGATAAQVAQQGATDARATELLLNALVAAGALTKREDVFANTPDSARFLVEGAPESQRAGLLHTVHLWTTWSTLTDCVRSGSPAQTPGVEARQPEWTRAFIAAMHNGAAAQAQVMIRAVATAGATRLLDIGGGSAAYSIAFAKSNPALRAQVFDLPAVVPLADSYIAAVGLSDRITTRCGDLRRDEFGSGYDVALLSAICHMLGPDENQDLFRRCHRALRPGGRLVIREFILDPAKTSPKSAVLFALNMLVGTNNGASYSEIEYRDWLSAAGFSAVSRPDPAGDLLIALR